MYWVVLMAQVNVVVSFDQMPDDTDGSLAHLTRELELDLCEIGIVEYLPTEPSPDAKGVGEVVAATVSVLTAAEPAYIEALVKTVAAFLRRNEGRSARLKVGDAELAIEQPSERQVDELIRMMWTVVERERVER